MYKLQPILICLFLLIFPFFGKSQNMNIQGTVYDSSGVNPLKNAVIMAVRIKDSIMLDFSHSNSSGKFTLLNCPIDTFSLIVSYPKCDDKTYLIFGHSANYEINIPKIKLQPESKELEAVIIYANKNPIFYKGDTLVYVADSFKVAENAVVEDLLKKLPGIKIEKDGTIKSQGKKINQVLVDGDEFFGSDASIATKNLGAKGVETVEVYEKKNENAIEGEDEMMQVMNLKLKEDAKKGYFGRTSLASDFKDFYQGELLLNKFNGSKKISVFALSSNTPRSKFNWGEQQKFGLENEADYQYDQELDTWMMNSDLTGIPKTFKSGIYYADKVGKKDQTKLNFNYSFTDSKVNAYSKSRSQYFLGDTTYFSDDSTHNYQFDQKHRINMSAITQLDSLTVLTIQPIFTYDLGKTEDFDQTNFLSEDIKLTRENSIVKVSDTKALGFENKLGLDKKFKKPKREFNFNYNFSSKTNSSIGKLLSENSFFDVLYMNDTTDQAKDFTSNKQDHKAKVKFIEPLSKKINIEFEYQFEYGNSNQTKETRNKLNGDYSVLNLDYSNKFENKIQQNKLGTLLTYKTKKYNVGAGVKARNIDILSKNIISTDIVHQNLNNLLPQAYFHFLPTMSKRIGFNYRTISQQASINDLQPVPDNTNPNRVMKGNPNLKPSYSHRFSLNFNTWEALSGRYIYANMNLNYTNNDFAKSTTFDPLVIGKMESQTINVQGNYEVYLNGGTGFNLLKTKLFIRPNVNANYSKNYNLINGNRNSILNRSVAGDLEISYSKDSLQLSCSGNMTFNSPLNSISTISNKSFTTKSIYGSFLIKLPLHFIVSSEATYTMNGQRSNGYNINYLIWNSEISKAFLKTENLIVSMVGNDILNQNISANRTISANVITDNKTKIISRYFLLKLILKFNNNKTKEDDGQEEW